MELRANDWTSQDREQQYYQNNESKQSQTVPYRFRKKIKDLRKYQQR